MRKSNIERGKEVIQAGSDVAGLVKDVGIPGVGLIARLVQHFCNTRLRKRLEKFIPDTEIDEQLLSKVPGSKIYSNYLCGILEIVRQTHPRIGLIVLALIYKERQNDETYLIVATQTFLQVSDVTINAFISLYESIPEDKNHLVLKIQKGDESHFHNLYNEAVELIRRNSFAMGTSVGMHFNGPM